MGLSEDETLQGNSEVRPGGLIARAAAFLEIREGEGRLVTLSVALMFVPCAGTAIGVASAESLFLSRVGADALPPLYVVLGLVTVAATLGITALLGRMPPARLYLLMPILLALVLAGARFLVEIDLDGIYRALWVTVFVIDTFTRLVLWGIAGLSFDTRQAKRLFPLFVAAGILGFAVGGMLTRPLVDLLGTENLLIVWASTLLAALVLAQTITRTTGADTSRSRRAMQRKGGRRTTRLRDDLQAGFQYVRRSQLMIWVAAMAMLGQAVYFLLAFPFSRAVEMNLPVEDEMTAFLGVFRGITTGTAFLVSLLVATRLNARFGLMAGLLTLAVSDVIAFSLLSVWSPFIGIVAFRFLHDVWQSGIIRTAWFALFNVVPSARREQTRMFINGVCLQGGVILVGVTLLIGTELMQARRLFIIGAVVAALFLYAIVRARAAYLSALVDALHAGRPQVFSHEEDPFSGFRQEAAATNVAIAGLSDADPAVRRVAADILSNLDVPEAAPALVEALSDENPEVRIAVLPALARLDLSSAWENVVACLSDPEAEVRAAAVLTLRRLAKGDSNFPMHVQPLLEDAVPAVRAAAAAALLVAGPHGRAQRTLLDMCDAEDTESRAEAVKNLGRWGKSEAFGPANRALGDNHPTVRRAAAEALARIDHPRCLDTLASALCDEHGSVRETVAASIAAIGEPALERVLHCLDDPGLESGALLTLERLPVGTAQDTIRAYARDRVGKALHYHRLWRQTPQLIARNPRAELLGDALRHISLGHAINALRAVGAIEDSRAVAAAIDSLGSNDPVQRANAVETLDSIADRDIVRPALRLWEPEGHAAAAHAHLPPEQVLRQSLEDSDAWLRACAALAADGVGTPEIRAELNALAQNDPDATVRETAAASNGGRPMHTLDTLSLMERILFLKRVPLFANLPPAEVKQVASIADEQLFVDGELIAQQNEPGDELYVIVSGQVRVTVAGDGGEESVVALRGTGEYVGEMAVISNMPRMAKLVAVGEVRALCIEHKQFEGILRERPETSLAVMRELCERLRERESPAH